MYVGLVKSFIGQLFSCYTFKFIAVFTNLEPGSLRLVELMHKKSLPPACDLKSLSRLILTFMKAGHPIGF